jgi:hypothetical protein
MLRIWFRIRIRPEFSFGFGSESCIPIQIRNWLKFLFFVLKFYAALTSNLRSTSISHMYAYCMCIMSLPHDGESLAALSTRSCRWHKYRCDTIAVNPVANPNRPLKHILNVQPVLWIRIRPYVFGPPGAPSGSVSQRYGSGFIYHQAK